MTDQEQKRVQAAIDKADRETLSALLRIMEAKATGNDKELIEAIKQTPEEVIEKALPVMVEMLTPPPPTANAPKMNRLLTVCYLACLMNGLTKSRQRERSEI